MSGIDPRDLTASLAEATVLVGKVGRRELSLPEFVARYNNYYYAAALDGHEGGSEFRAFLEEHNDIVALHRQVQTLLDAMYSSKSVENSQLPPDRATPDETLRQLSDLCQIHDIPALLSLLGFHE